MYSTQTTDKGYHYVQQIRSDGYRTIVVGPFKKLADAEGRAAELNDKEARG